MEPEVWSKLPDELLLHVLAKLPPIHLLRLRSVSKRWNHLPLHRPFLQLRSHLAPSPPGFVIRSSASPNLHYIDPLCSRWLTLPLDFLPSALSCDASADGLLCCSETRTTGRAVWKGFHIWNPVTRAWRKLPPGLERRTPFLVGLSYDSTTGNYKVVVVGRKAEADHYKIYDMVLDMTAEVYDSKCHRWRTAATVPGASLAYSEPLFSNGMIYWL